MNARERDRHRSPRLPPISIEQEHIDKITAIAERINLPNTWVIRKLLIEALEEVDIESLPVNIFRTKTLKKGGIGTYDDDRTES